MAIARAKSVSGRSGTALKPAMQRQVGDAAVKARTGLGWSEWFDWLDRQRAAQLDHRGIVALLQGKKQLGSWWRQMVAVAYEQARGLRVLHQKTHGFEISASKVLDMPVHAAYAAFVDARRRARWLPGVRLTIHKATANKSLRITWSDGQKSLNVDFYPKPNDRAQVAVQHGKLPTAAAAARMQAYWRSALTRLAGR